MCVSDIKANHEWVNEGAEVVVVVVVQHPVYFSVNVQGSFFPVGDADALGDCIIEAAALHPAQRKEKAWSASD